MLKLVLLIVMALSYLGTLMALTVDGVTPMAALMAICGTVALVGIAITDRIDVLIKSRG